MRRIALIPARGGSKRIPGKNVHPFHGRPLLAWTASSALETGLFERVLVSTEDPEIADAAREAGTGVDTRAPDLATDTARVTDVCFDLLDREAEAGRTYDTLCVLYATAPLRTASDIAATVALAESGQTDFAMAVTYFDLPAHQALYRRDDDTLAPLNPKLITARSSDVGEVVVDNGSTYAVSVAAFREVEHFYGPNLRGHVMPRSRSVDLDEPEDLALLEFYAQQTGFPGGRV